MKSDEWASVQVVIDGRDNLCVEDIERLLNSKSSDSGGRRWVCDLSAEDLDLTAQLSRLADFVSLNYEALTGIASDSEIVVHIGWTPRSPQDSVVFAGGLVQSIGGLGASVILDTYTEV